MKPSRTKRKHKPAAWRPKTSPAPIAPSPRSKPQSSRATDGGPQLSRLAVAMLGLGSGPISLFASEALQKNYLPKIAAGELIAAFAISEPSAGSDVRSMQTMVRRDGNSFVINGTKTWISNADLADFYTVFCRYPEGG